MDLIANQHDVSSSAPAENRFSHAESPAAMQSSRETLPSDVKDPGTYLCFKDNYLVSVGGSFLIG